MPAVATSQERLRALRPPNEELSRRRREQEAALRAARARESRRKVQRADRARRAWAADVERVARVRGEVDDFRALLRASMTSGAAGRGDEDESEGEGEDEEMKEWTEWWFADPEWALREVVKAVASHRAESTGSSAAALRVGFSMKRAEALVQEAAHLVKVTPLELTEKDEVELRARADEAVLAWGRWRFAVECEPDYGNDLIYGALYSREEEEEEKEEEEKEEEEEGSQERVPVSEVTHDFMRSRLGAKRLRKLTGIMLKEVKFTELRRRERARRTEALSRIVAEFGELNAPTLVAEDWKDADFLAQSVARLFATAEKWRIDNIPWGGKSEPAGPLMQPVTAEAVWRLAGAVCDVTGAFLSAVGHEIGEAAVGEAQVAARRLLAHHRLLWAVVFGAALRPDKLPTAAVSTTLVLAELIGGPAAEAHRRLVRAMDAVVEALRERRPESELLRGLHLRGDLSGSAAVVTGRTVLDAVRAAACCRVADSPCAFEFVFED